MWLGHQLANLYVIPPWAIVAIVCALITSFTEVTSNTATATIFLPILASLVSELLSVRSHKNTLGLYKFVRGLGELINREEGGLVYCLFVCMLIVYNIY